MSNLIINIQFGVWFWQVTREWESSFGKSQYWVEQQEKKQPVPKFKIRQLFFYNGN